MTITDEIVLAAAQAGINQSAASETSSVSFSQRRYVYYAGFDLRAALEAAAPAIRRAALEEAAAFVGRSKDVERTDSGSEWTNAFWTGYDDAARDIEIALSTLADKEGT